MLDPLFSFVDPIVELSEDTTCFVIPVDVFFDFIQQSGIDRPINLPEGTKTGMPLDIAMSLLRPDELEKLQKYIASYQEKHGHP